MQSIYEPEKVYCYIKAKRLIYQIALIWMSVIDFKKVEATN